MRIFVINLARRKDRLAHVRRQLWSFERVEAIDGALAENPNVDRFRFWCSKGYGIRPGEIGCAMSHQIVYRKMIDEKIDMACVLEDDVTLMPRFLEKINGWERWLQTDVPTVMTFGVTAAGYLINRAGAELMLKLNTPIRSTADDWWRWVRGGLHWQKIDGILTVPSYGNPMAEGVAKSDIVGDARHLLSHKSVVGKIMYKLTRIFGKVCDWWMER